MHVFSVHLFTVTRSPAWWLSSCKWPCCECMTTLRRYMAGWIRAPEEGQVARLMTDINADSSYPKTVTYFIVAVLLAHGICVNVESVKLEDSSVLQMTRNGKAIADTWWSEWNRWERTFFRRYTIPTRATSLSPYSNAFKAARRPLLFSFSTIALTLKQFRYLYDLIRGAFWYNFIQLTGGLSWIW